MLNRKICLKCCIKALKSRFGGEDFQIFTESFNNDWKEFGILWCERQRAWMKNRENATSNMLVFYDKENEALIEKCPYLLEHTVTKC